MGTMDWEEFDWEKFDCEKLAEEIRQKLEREPELKLKWMEWAKAVRESLSYLTDRERKVLELRFGLKDKRPHTPEEVGQMLGVTPERIRQIEAKALRKLRHPLHSKRLPNAGTERSVEHLTERLPNASPSPGRRHYGKQPEGPKKGRKTAESGGEERQEGEERGEEGEEEGGRESYL